MQQFLSTQVQVEMLLKPMQFPHFWQALQSSRKHILVKSMPIVLLMQQ